MVSELQVRIFELRDSVTRATCSQTENLTRPTCDYKRSHLTRNVSNWGHDSCHFVIALFSLMLSIKAQEGGALAPLKRERLRETDNERPHRLHQQIEAHGAFLVQ